MSTRHQVRRLLARHRMRVSLVVQGGSGERLLTRFDREGGLGALAAAAEKKLGFKPAAFYVVGARVVSVDDLVENDVVEVARPSIFGPTPLEAPGHPLVPPILPKNAFGYAQIPDVTEDARSYSAGSPNISSLMLPLRRVYAEVR